MSDDGTAEARGDTAEADADADADADAETDGPVDHTVSGEPTADTTDADDHDWQFSIADLEDDDTGDDGTTDTDSAGSESAVAGPVTSKGPLEPGSISRENALFVGVGVLIALGLLASVLIGF